MSATIDTSIFSKFFGNCPIIELEGRVFPVQGQNNTISGEVSLLFEYFIFDLKTFDGDLRSWKHPFFDGLTFQYQMMVYLGNVMFS